MISLVVYIAGTILGDQGEVVAVFAAALQRKVIRPDKSAIQE